MSNSECFIWPGHPAFGYFTDGPHNVGFANSPRADGGYIGDLELRLWLSALNDEQKARLTTWLVDQRSQGVIQPRISKDILQYIKAKPPLSPFERATRLLRYIARHTESVGTLFKFIQESETVWRAYAHSESTKWEEVEYLLGYLRETGWLD